MIVFGSAPCKHWAFLAPYRSEGRTVVCADGGLQLAREAGFSPEVYIGDSDSGGTPEQALSCRVLPPEKDLTDMQAAYAYCLEHGATDLILTACTGGRQDHHLANLALLETAWEQGITARILDADNEITYLPAGTTTFFVRGFRYFGIVPLDRTLEDVSITNAKYELAHACVRRGDSLTISNEPLEGPVVVRIGRGSALLVRSARIL